MHQRQSIAFDFFFHDRKNVLLCLLVFRQEHQACAVLSFLGNRNALQENEFMRNLYQNACTVTRLVTCFGTAVFHVFKYSQGVVHQFMALAAMNIHNHADATSIVFVRFVV